MNLFYYFIYCKWDEKIRKKNIFTFISVMKGKKTSLFGFCLFFYGNNKFEIFFFNSFQLQINKWKNKNSILHSKFFYFLCSLCWCRWIWESADAKRSHQYRISAFRASSTSTTTTEKKTTKLKNTKNAFVSSIFSIYSIHFACLLLSKAKRKYYRKEKNNQI